MATVTVLGAGMMGSALCVPIVDRGHEVRLVGTPLDGAIVESLKRDRVHPTLNKGHTMPEGITPYAVEELPAAMEGAELVVIGVSSQGVRWAGEALGPWASPELPVLMITKGLEWTGESFLLMPDALQRALPEGVRDGVSPCAVAGPCIAGELANRAETCVVFTGRDMAHVRRFAQLFGTDYYHVWPWEDVVGAEVCAALKNAYALAIAFAIGIDERRGGAGGSVAMHNYESAVFAQAAVETQEVVAMLGGEPRTVFGLAGVGDLDVTCNGGRTGRFGRWIGTGLSIPEAIEAMEGATLECIDIIEVFQEALPALEASGKIGAGSLPLMRHLVEVVLEHKPLDMPFGRFFGG